MQDALKSISDIDLSKLTANREYFPSPDDWEDEVIYFLMVDRFSDGEESQETLYRPEEDYENIKEQNAEEEWRQWGVRWNGGTLKGVASKLDYLQQLGVTAVWLSPILKQVPFREDYHGYGTQNYLQVDPHFGTKQDLKELADQAHERGMRVILDIIINHSGDVFAYEQDDTPWIGEEYSVKAYRDSEGNPTLPFEESADLEEAWPDGAVWPRELQSPDNWQRMGSITDWEHYPEYVEGDFLSLKTHYLGSGDPDDFQGSPALKTLTEVYKYWIAYADLDGFRVDTVKHMEWGATRYFVQQIHEFTKAIGKKNFYLIGEITGGLEYAMEAFNKTGLNAALGINAIPDQMENCAKGHLEPEPYFNIFSNTDLLGEDDHQWYRDNVVTMFDDHDMVTLGGESKYRFAARSETAPLLLNALFLNVMTLGIPCIYYGTEQGFDGHGDGDRYIRECMFAGNFGAFRTQGRHFFDPSHPVYQGLSRLLKLRHEHLLLRQGRQYIRKISYDGETFELPRKMGEGRMTSVVAWSRIFNGGEAVLAFNTDLENRLSVYVPVDDSLHAEGDTFEILFRSDDKQIGQSLQVKQLGEQLVIPLEVPSAGCIMGMKG